MEQQKGKAHTKALGLTRDPEKENVIEDWTQNNTAGSDTILRPRFLKLKTDQEKCKATAAHYPKDWCSGATFLSPNEHTAHEELSVFSTLLTNTKSWIFYPGMMITLYKITYYNFSISPNFHAMNILKTLPVVRISLNLTNFPGSLVLTSPCSFLSALNMVIVFLSDGFAIWSTIQTIKGR